MRPLLTTCLPALVLAASACPRAAVLLGVIPPLAHPSNVVKSCFELKGQCARVDVA